MKLAVVGSRGIKECDLDSLVPLETTEIISGGARGVDTLAVEYARKRGIPVREFFPDYERYGRKAPLIRNEQIVVACDQVLAVWDGHSSGTMYTVRLAHSLGKPVRLCRLKPNEEPLEGQTSFWK